MEIDAGIALRRPEITVEGPPGARVVRVSGRVRLGDADRLRERTLAAAEDASGTLTLALAEVESVEGGAAAVLVELRDGLRARGLACELAGARPAVAALLALYDPGGAAPPEARPRRGGVLADVGAAAVRFVRECLSVLGFVGALFLSLVRLLRHPREVRWRDVPSLCERTGADGLPIILLVNLLVGLIIALQSALQMQRFGAQVFVADLVGLAIARELGPLMTAILVAGRSGAAFAAELGTMRVHEEIDALEALRIDPLAHLVVPRVLALVLVVPFLTLLGDLVGMLGGMAVAVFSVDMGWEVYVRRTAAAVGLSDVVVGLLKSASFAAAIALVACQRGLAARGGATGVGTSTTSAVVTTLFTLIVLDALFTALFNVLGV